MGQVLNDKVLEVMTVSQCPIDVLNLSSVRQITDKINTVKELLNVTLGNVSKVLRANQRSGACSGRAPSFDPKLCCLTPNACLATDCFYREWRWRRTCQIEGSVS